MADAINTVTVDGVEPSILVKLLNVVDNPHSVKVGVDKWLYKEFEAPVLLTTDELSKLGSFAVEIVKDVEKEISTQAQIAPDSGVVKLPPTNPTIGQSSPQV